MNGKTKILMAAALFCVGTCAFARPHHHHNEGLELANGIVDLVCRVLKPAPVVVTQPAVVTPAPVVVTQPAVVTPAPVVVTPAPVVVAPPPRPVYRPVPQDFSGFTEKQKADFSVACEIGLTISSHAKWRHSARRSG